jgi:1-acyl-sn-glycerol-3-phosphate acyltransferase
LPVWCAAQEVSWSFMAEGETSSGLTATTTVSVETKDGPARKYVYRGEGTGWFQWIAWNAGRMVSAVLAMLLFRLHVRGQGMIPRSGGVLLVTNHQSFLDPWLMGIAPGRQVHYMARDTLYKGGFLHWLMELLNAFPVKRGTADLGAIRMAVERLDKGYVVNVFPEGTRSEDGAIGTVAPGVSLILHRTKKPVQVMPVVIDGAFEAWPRKAKYPKMGVIRMAFGKPMTAEEWRGMSAEELARRIRRELVGLQEQVRSAHAAASRRRMMEDEAKAAAEPAKGRRRRARGERRGEAEG